MLLRVGRRAALLLAATAAFSRLRDPDTAVYVSASPPQPPRQAFSSSAAAEGLRSGTCLFSPYLLPYPFQGFPVLNTFTSASVSPANNGDQGSDGSSGDPRCCPACLGRNSIAKAASAVGPAVVNISSMHGENISVYLKTVKFLTSVVAMCSELLELPFVDMHGWVNEQSIGSGTIIDPDGTILTCAHVVADFQSTKAIVRRKIKSMTPLPAARLGSSSQLQPGDWVVALGCPLSLQNTVTAGIVSCVDRKSSDLGLGGLRREYLQTDCAINQGNSGGPLVNLDGEIIGVNVMKVRNADGLSFAVPIDSVIKIVDNFNKNGRVVRPWLGLKMLDLNPMIIAQLKEKSSTFPDVRKGVLVPMVTPASPAEQAGFRPGDVVVEFGGKPVESIKEVTKDNY
uniref:PDZ domain-containing protein n=1 Tax=Zea mays TaxID=4577 RepID=A0A804NKV9_MAIZE